MTDTHITMNFYNLGEPFKPNTDFVDKDFLMDPRTDDLLATGSLLKEGMVVLIEDHLSMEDPTKYGDSKYTDRRLLENNRWATVTEIHSTPENRHLISFVAVYADGTKYKRTYNRSYAWYVKKASIPVESPTGRNARRGPFGSSFLDC